MLAAERRALPGEDAKGVRPLVTPEGVTLHLTLGSAGVRAGAFLIDLLILAGFFSVMTLALILAGAAIGKPLAWRAAGVLWLTGAFVLRNLYFVLWESQPRGSTFGKRWLGLRVVARHGGRLTLDAVIARNAMREVEFYMPLSFASMQMATGGVDNVLALLGLGWSGLFLLMPLFNRDRLRAGDLLAGTWVILAPRRALLPELTETAAEPAAFGDADLDAYGVYELETLERVIRQDHPASTATAADTIRMKLGRDRWGDDGGEYDLAFLQDYYAALRRRLEQKLLFGKRRRDKHDRA